MEEIKFFGINRDKINQALSKFGLKELNNCPIKVPFSYIFNLQEAKDLEATSFPWPMLVKLNNDGEVFAPSHMVKGHGELQELLNSVNSGENTSVIFSRPPILNSTYQNSFFYLAHNYIGLQDFQSGSSSVVNMNNRKLFEEAGLEEKYVYRLVSSSAGWLVENIIRAEDPRLGFLTKQLSVDSLSISESLLVDFKRGYRAGFFEKIISNEVILHDLENGYLVNPYNFGYEVGKNIQFKLICFLNNAGIQKNLMELINKNLGMYLKIVGFYNDEAKVIIDFHNRFQESTLDSISLILRDYFSFNDKAVNWNKLLSNYVQLIKGLRKEKNPEYDQEEMIFKVSNEIDKVENKSEFTFKTMQVRIASSDNGGLLSKDLNRINLRIQVSDWKFKQKVYFDSMETDGFTIIDLANPGNFEMDLVVRRDQVADFDLYISEFQKLDHPNKSHAGTDKKYAPVALVGDSFCNPVNGFSYFSMNAFKTNLTKHHGADISFPKLISHLNSSTGEVTEEVTEEVTGEEEASYDDSKSVFKKLSMDYGASNVKTGKFSLDLDKNIHDTLAYYKKLLDPLKDTLTVVTSSESEAAFTEALIEDEYDEISEDIDDIDDNYDEEFEKW